MTSGHSSDASDARGASDARPLGDGSPDAPAAVLIDLDGTLVDTTYLHVLAWWRAFDEAGVGHPMSAIHPLIGMGSDQLLERLGATGRDDLNDAHGRHFADLHHLVRPLPGAAALLRRIASSGAQVVLVTSAKPDDRAPLLDPLDAADAIAAVIDSSQADRSKPAPDLFTTALETCALDRHRSIAVGDAVWDVEAAGRAGVACVGLRTGGVNAGDLTRAGAVAVYDDCASILADWADSPVGRLVEGRDASRAVGPDRPVPPSERSVGL